MIFLTVLLVFFDLFVKLFDILIIGRILMNLMGVSPDVNFLARILFETTEPVLVPIRKLLPKTNFDIAPMVAVLMLYGLHFLIFHG